MLSTKVNLKACPRCRGDLFMAADIYGYYWSCAQCSHDIDIQEPSVAPQLEDLSGLSTTQEKELAKVAA